MFVVIVWEPATSCCRPAVDGREVKWDNLAVKAKWTETLDLGEWAAVYIRRLRDFFSTLMRACVCVSIDPPSAICLCLPHCKSIICSTSFCSALPPHPTTVPLSATHPWAYFCYPTQRNSVNLPQHTRLCYGRHGMFGRWVFNTYFHASFECFCTLVFSIDALRRRQPICSFLCLRAMFCQTLVWSWTSGAILHNHSFLYLGRYARMLAA